MTVIDSSIDCTIPCFQLLRMFNSCPTRKINYTRPFNSKDIHEILMVIFSLSPYPISFLLLTAGTYFRTTRSILILMMIFIQNFLVEILKNNLKDPRPNYKCNLHYGNPSNHATFFTSLITWFIMEYIMLKRKYLFQYKTVLFCLFTMFPFVIYSRLYLKYHSIEQIITGIMLGVFVGVSWFIVGINYILPSDNPIRRIFENFHLKNTLTSTVIIADDNVERSDNDDDQEELNKKYQMLLEKNNQLNKLKNDLKHLTNNVKNMDFMKKEVGKSFNQETIRKEREIQNKEMNSYADQEEEEEEIEYEEEEENEEEISKEKSKDTQKPKSEEQD